MVYFCVDRGHLFTWARRTGQSLSPFRRSSSGNEIRWRYTSYCLARYPFVLGTHFAATRNDTGPWWMLLIAPILLSSRSPDDRCSFLETPNNNKRVPIVNWTNIIEIHVNGGGDRLASHAMVARRLPSFNERTLSTSFIRISRFTSLMNFKCNF